MNERCAICGCALHRKADTYGKPTIEGRSHATSHHFVAERFFGRSANRPGTKTEGVFDTCPWGIEGQKTTFCFECHEELLHNPVLTPEDIEHFARLVELRGLSEVAKSKDRAKLAGRIQLFNEVISRGLTELLSIEQSG